MGFNEDQLKKQYYGKNFVWAVPITNEQVGDPTRCLGVRRREADGVMCLQLSSGMPVPIDRVNFHLKATDFDVAPPESTENANFELTRDERFVNNQPQQNSQPIRQQNNPQVKCPVQDPGMTSLFGNFTKKKEKISIEVETELPDFDLVKLMYKNSANKTEFVSKFSEYIKQSINIDSITKSVASKFEIEEE